MPITKLRALGAVAIAASALAVAVTVVPTAAADPYSTVYQWYTNGGGPLNGKVAYNGRLNARRALAAIHSLVN